MIIEIIDTLNKAKNGKDATFAALERDLGIGNGTIKKWKKSKPSLDMLLLISDYFHVSLDYLCGKQLEKETSPATDLTEDEATVIELYRELTERDKGKVEGFIRAILQSETYQKDTSLAVS